MPTTNPGAQPVPEFQRDEKEHRRQIARRVNSLTQGKFNATASVTLAANASSTTLSDTRIGAFSWIGLMPLTAHAAAELASGNLYFSGLMSGAGGGSGSVTINHTNNAQTDRTFLALIIG